MCRRSLVGAAGGGGSGCAGANSWSRSLPVLVHSDIGAAFVEKPIARTLTQAKEIVEAAEKAKAPLMPGHVLPLTLCPVSRSRELRSSRGWIGRRCAGNVAVKWHRPIWEFSTGFAILGLVTMFPP